MKMHGKALDGSDKMVEVEVHNDNVEAFKRSGYVEGGLPEAEKKAEAETEKVADADEKKSSKK